MAVALFTLAAVGGLWLLHLVYVAAMAAVGRRFGLVLRDASVGVGPTVWGRRPGSVWKFKPLPLGGYARFLPDHEDGDHAIDAAVPPPGSMAAAPAWVRLLVVLAGPASNILIGLLLLAGPVFAGAPQLAVVGDAPGEWLGHTDEPSSAAGQLRLAADTGGEYARRLVTFESLAGWGGWMAFANTAGRAAAGSLADGATLFGLLAACLGLINLLPVPPLNGFHAVRAGLAAVTGREWFARSIGTLSIPGVLVTLAVNLRVMLLDVRWVFDRVSALAAAG